MRHFHQLGMLISKITCFLVNQRYMFHYLYYISQSSNIIKFDLSNLETVKMTDPQKQQKNKLNLHIKCQELNKIFYKQTLNPYVVVSSQKYNKKPEIIHKSQALINNFNPSFNEPVHIQQAFQDNQTFIFQIYNYGFDSKPVAQMKLTAYEITKAVKGVLIRQLDTGFKKGGKMTVHVNQTNTQNQLMHLKLRGEQLLSQSWKGWFGPKLLYARINRIEGNSCESLYVSEELPYNKCIQWREFYIQCNSTLQTFQNSKIEILLCSRKKEGEENIVAKCQILGRDLTKTTQFDLLENQRHRRGKLVIVSHRTEIENTFSEFVQAGLNINLMVGIDFSASILPASHHESPHHIGNGKSIYQQALDSITSLMLSYTNANSASVYAIGAKIKHPNNFTGQKVQQCFSINGSCENQSIQGGQKILQQYRTILGYLKFSGPTDIGVIIKKALQQSVKSKKLKQQYTVLAILCDGKLTNIKQIQELLKQCATLPIYIVLLAIGNSDEHLKELTSVKMQVVSAENIIVVRQNLINVGSYMGKGDNICDSIRQSFKNLPYVISRYMSLKKKTPESLCNKIKKLKEKVNPQA